MTMLKVEDMVFQRGEGGVLIAQEVTLETLPNKPTIKAIPVTGGKLKEIGILAKSNIIADKIKSDNMLIKHGLIEPKLTDEDIEVLKPQYSGAVAIAIMAISLDMTQKEVETKAEDAIQDAENELKKKSEKTT